MATASAALEVMVVPPEGASYFSAAYLPGTVEPNKLAWVVPNPEPNPAGHGMEHDELLEMPRVVTDVKGYDERLSLVGVVYADSPVATAGSRLESVAVAATGFVTLVDTYFSDSKKDCTCGDVVYARASGEKVELGHQKGFAAPAMDGFVKVGRIMEIGSRGDARLLLHL